MFGTRGNGGAAGTGGNDVVVPQITQPTQAELDATAEALANQQEMTRLRGLETERVRLATEVSTKIKIHERWHDLCLVISNRPCSPNRAEARCFVNRD